MPSSFPCSNCKKECISELIGTYLLVAFGAGSVIVASLISNISALESLIFVAFSFGATVGIVILFLGKYSGAVINPAITCGAVLAKVLHSRYFMPYLFFQISGGLLAGLTLRIIFVKVGSPSLELGSTQLAKGINPFVGLILETLGTFVLTISALIASTRIKNAKSQALLVGFTLFVLILLIAPFTGASFNPARSLGTALPAGYVQNLSVYLFAPVIGAVIAGLVFRAIRENGRKPRGNLVCLC